VQAFTRTVELRTEGAATCAVLQDRTNMLLNIGHSCILGAVATGVRVESIQQGDENDQVRQV